MKSVRALRPWLSALVVCCLGQVLPLSARAATTQSILLDKGWEFRQSTNLQGIAHSQWLPATVPGEVALDLLRNKLVHDPLFPR